MSGMCTASYHFVKTSAETSSDFVILELTQRIPGLANLGEVLAAIVVVDSEPNRWETSCLMRFMWYIDKAVSREIFYYSDRYLIKLNLNQ